MTPGLSLPAAAELTRTGDIWLFRGRSGPDRAIQTVTNAPVNHVGMALVLEDLPPLIWHAELGRSLVDVWTGQHHRGAQLHDLDAAVRHWHHRYQQRAWLRQLSPIVSRAQEDAALQMVAQLAGTPFPAAARLAGRWVAGRLRRHRSPRDDTMQTAYCAELVARGYQAMGLLPGDVSPSWYDPGRFWSGDHLLLLLGAELAEEIAASRCPFCSASVAASSARRSRSESELMRRCGLTLSPAGPGIGLESGADPGDPGCHRRPIRPLWKEPDRSLRSTDSGDPQWPQSMTRWPAKDWCAR